MQNIKCFTWQISTTLVVCISNPGPTLKSDSLPKSNQIQIHYSNPIPGSSSFACAPSLVYSFSLSSTCFFLLLLLFSFASSSSSSFLFSSSSSSPSPFFSFLSFLLPPSHFGVILMTKADLWTVRQMCSDLKLCSHVLSTTFCHCSYQVAVL